jgi:hypothetical protein
VTNRSGALSLFPALDSPDQTEIAPPVVLLTGYFRHHTDHQAAAAASWVYRRWVSVG